MRLIGLAVVLGFGLFLVSPAAESQPKTLPLVAVLDPGTAFATIVNGRTQAPLVQDAQMLSLFSERVTALALRDRLPTLSEIPRFAERGGLLQYGADVFELFRRSATHLDKMSTRATSVRPESRKHSQES